MQESKDIQRFKEFYSKLPENYQSIVGTAILEMEKEHKIEATKKQISIKDVIGFPVSQFILSGTVYAV